MNTKVEVVFVLATELVRVVFREALDRVEVVFGWKRCRSLEEVGAAAD